MKRNAYYLMVFALVFILTAGSLAFGAGPKKPAKSPSIVEVAIAVNTEGPFAGQFDILIEALLAADPGVIETLSGKGQFTVFAPTDDAFVALDEELAGLGLSLADVVANTEYLTDVLLYHVARGRRYSEDVLDSTRIRMLDGGFNFQDGGYLRDNLGRYSQIIVTDVEASNGVIHAIDTVVIPYLP
jgi:uncharacterized surface protein with fasciclin (FAS1) repeats